MAAQEAQSALGEGPIRLRMGLHTGSPLLDPPKYVGMDVHLAARIMSAGHGGQVLLSKATRDLVETSELRDLGEHRVKDFDEPVWIFQLGGESFPPLKTISNTNLPRPVSSFVGREREVAEVVALGPGRRAAGHPHRARRVGKDEVGDRVHGGTGGRVQGGRLLGRARVPSRSGARACQPWARSSVQGTTWPATSASGRCSC